MGEDQKTGSRLSAPPLSQLPFDLLQIDFRSLPLTTPTAPPTQSPHLLYLSYVSSPPALLLLTGDFYTVLQVWGLLGELPASQRLASEAV